MDRLETELQHMLRMLAPPFTEGWKAQCWHRAKELAKDDPEMADLPALLAEAMKKSPDTPGPQSKPKRKTPPATTESR